MIKNESMRLHETVSASIADLQHRYLVTKSPQSRATLAHLRLAAAGEPGASAEAWSVTLASLPERLMGFSDDANRFEIAAHTALTFYAIHQRGNAQPMHVGGREYSFAHGVGVMARGRSQSVKARYDALLSATSWKSRKSHLRSLVGLLSADAVAIDYGSFVNDLVDLQSPRMSRSVAIRWGRDFFISYTKTSMTQSDEPVEF